MKKIVRLFGLLLLATLLFSVMGGNAFAANGAVPIGEDDTVAVMVKFDSLTEEDYAKYQASVSTPAAEIVTEDQRGPGGDPDPEDEPEDGAGPGEGGGDRGADPVTPAKPILPNCTITVTAGGDETALAEGAVFPFSALFADGVELRIAPPPGYYVSGLALTNESGPV